jgi:hypothetical protein
MPSSVLTAGGRIMVLTPATGSTLARAGRPQHLKRAFTFNEHTLARKSGLFWYSRNADGRLTAVRDDVGSARQ